MISRAYLKMREALAWSQMPIASGDICFEIGSSPGGAAQALLEAGLQVIGVDPAEMDERVMQHESFSHIRKRGRDVKRRDFAAAKWLVVDSNVAPEQTLDTVRDIVTHDSVRIRGMLLTLKFPTWSAAGALDDYLARIREWGFQHVKPRQLAYNRQEVCVAAFKNRSMRRFAGGQRKKH
jgi:23S rRNA (cytidine2498-2'-O)-methyltransferase